MGMFTIFNVFEAAGFSTSLYDRSFSYFLSSSVNKENIAHSSFNLFTPSCLTLFFQLDLFQGVP